jgi:hypothetical protein
MAARFRLLFYHGGGFDSALLKPTRDNDYAGILGKHLELSFIDVLP